MNSRGNFRPALAAVFPWLAAAVALPAATGLVAAWWALSQPAREVLRQEWGAAGCWPVRRRSWFGARISSSAC